MTDYNYEGCTRFLAGCAAIVLTVLGIAVTIAIIAGFVLAQKGA